MDSSVSNNLNRKALLESREFWEEYIKTELYNIVDEYMKDNHLTQTQLAQNLGVSKGYISQVLNGESDHRISKMVELALHCGKVPYIYFKDLEEVLQADMDGDGVFNNFEGLNKSKSNCKKTERQDVKKNILVI